MPTFEQLKTPAIALGLAYVLYRYGGRIIGGDATKAAALGLMAVIVGKQVPYIKDAI